MHRGWWKARLPDRARERQSWRGLQGSAGLRFALRFGGISLLLFGAYCFPYAEVGLSEAFFNAYLDGYTRVVSSILRLFENGLAVSFNRIHGRFSIEVAKGCDAMDCNILFTSAILAHTGRWGQKGLALLAGLAAIAGINVVRVVSLYYTGLYWPSRFSFVHTILWPLLMLSLTVALFLVATALTRRAPKGSLATSVAR